jgi:hypothetical protein
LSDDQQQALLLYAKILELKAIGGTDYTPSLMGQSGTPQIVQDALTLFNGFTADQLTCGLINLNFIRANAAGATVPGGANTPGNVAVGLQLAQLGNFFFTAIGFNPNNAGQVNPVILQKIFTLLEGKLGVHKAYPQ